jgi:hypothetical protein
MARRRTVNRTGLARIEGIAVHDAFVGYICLKCSTLNHVKVGEMLLDPHATFAGAEWLCKHCGYVHSSKTDLPFSNWPKSFRKHTALQSQRFWLGFFRIATEHPESYWKQCNACGRILPFHAFSKHAGWGALQRQMECRSCKGAINAVLNVLRTPEQLHESAARRRVAGLLLKGEDQRIDHTALFRRFGGKCFKTGRSLDIRERGTWAIDHVLPSQYLYPLSVENAALLSREANNAKAGRWPSHFYTNSELIQLSRITGADLNLLASREPIVNPNIDVNACVTRFLKVRERSNLKKRLDDLRQLLSDYAFADQLSPQNKEMLAL